MGKLMLPDFFYFFFFQEVFCIHFRKVTQNTSSFPSQVFFWRLRRSLSGRLESPFHELS